MKGAEVVGDDPDRRRRRRCVSTPASAPSAPEPAPHPASGKSPVPPPHCGRVHPERRCRLPLACGAERTSLAWAAEKPRVTTIAFDVPGWPGHRAGQHVDVRLTAADGYQARRSHSIAWAPDGTRVKLTVVRIEHRLRPGTAGRPVLAAPPLRPARPSSSSARSASTSGGDCDAAPSRLRGTIEVSVIACPSASRLSCGSSSGHVTYTTRRTRPPRQQISPRGRLLLTCTDEVLGNRTVLAGGRGGVVVGCSEPRARQGRIAGGVLRR